MSLRLIQGQLQAKAVWRWNEMTTVNLIWTATSFIEAQQAAVVSVAGPLTQTLLMGWLRVKDGKIIIKHCRVLECNRKISGFVKFDQETK